MSNIYYEEKLRCKNFDFLGKKIWRNAPALKSKKVQGTFGEIFILALSSSAAFHVQNGVSDFSCFAQKISSFYQSSFGMGLISQTLWTFPQISWLKNKTSKNWDTVL